MYSLARELLFKLSPETSHELSIDLIGAGGRLGLNGLLTKAPTSLPVNVMGLQFANPVGLAAGLDKNGDAIDGFAQLGFGFVEIGTVTPRPQPGNPAATVSSAGGRGGDQPHGFQQPWCRSPARAGQGS